MPDRNKVSKSIYIRWFVLRALLIIYDVIAVNAAFFLALITRFYVAKEFHQVAQQYFDAYLSYAFFYTVFCLVVFACFKLYSGIWKYAGLHDLNRVLASNAICFAGHVVGTLLFGIRMPITFYCIGAVIQLCLVGISRFSYRLLLVEKKALFGSDSTSVNAIIVGVGSTARSAVRDMERDSSLRPVCLVDYKNENVGALFDGLPVVNGVESLKRSIEKHNAQLVLLAASAMPKQVRAQILEICSQCGVKAQDYTESFQGFELGVTLKALAECCTGQVEVSVGGSSRLFEDCEQAVESITGKYVVKSITAKGSILHIELGDNGIIQNDLNEEWVKKQQSETGEEISFF